MMRQGIISVISGLVISLGSLVNLRAQTNEPAGFREVYDLIRTHLAGINNQELDRAAIQGLVSALGPKVSLVTNGASNNSSENSKLLVRSTVFDGDIGYLRIGRVAEGLAPAVQKAYQQLGQTNKLKGIALDL